MQLAQQEYKVALARQAQQDQQAQTLLLPVQLVLLEHKVFKGILAQQELKGLLVQQGLRVHKAFKVILAQLAQRGHRVSKV